MDRLQSYGSTFLPFNVSLGSPDESAPQSNKFTLNYSQFQIGVKKQIDFAKVVYERFAELINQLEKMNVNESNM